MPANTPAYDMAPGGTRTTIANVETSGNGILINGSDYQTFTPTISALDVSAADGVYSPNLLYNVRNNISDPNRPALNKYAFEAYYAPDGISKPHININNGQPHQHPDIPDYTSDNSNWILNELAESDHHLPALLNSNTPANPYNYSSLYRRLLPSVTIEAGGQLFINNANLPNSGGVNTTNSPKESNFEVYTPSCGSRVQVNSGGSLTLGQPNDTHKASLRIARNSLLDLQNGGQTTVHAGSVLRIAAGGTLVVRAGTTLQVNGTLLVEAGAYVCVENPASIVTGTGGQLSYGPGIYHYANPALGLSGLSCRPDYPGCAPTLDLTYYHSGSRAAVVPGSPQQSDCALVYTVVATGQSLGNSYSWTVDGAPYATPAPPASPASINLVVNANNPNRTVAVTVNNLCNGQLLSKSVEVEGEFPDCPSVARPAVAMYPNPAGGALHFEPAVGAAEAEYEVSIYDGQGTLRWQGRSQGGRLELASGGLPRGLYGVVITQGKTISRRNLSLE